MGLLRGFELELFVELLALLLAFADLSFLLLGFIVVVTLQRQQLHSWKGAWREEVLRPTDLVEHDRALCVIVVIHLEELREQVVTLW